MRQISICIPTYNRTDLLYQSFENVIDNENVSEVVIVDDCSGQEVWDALQKKLTHPKIKLYRNEINEDCYRNKLTALSYATNEFAILLDSDNVIDYSYLYHIFQGQKWDKNTIYTPYYAEPHFDFRHFGGLLITRGNVSRWMDEYMFQTMLNAANYFVNVEEYQRVFDYVTDPVTSDSIYMAYRWLEAGNKIQVVEGLKYHHRVHSGSHYQNNVGRTPKGFHDEIVNKIRQLY